MRKPTLSRNRQGELFSPPAKLPELPSRSAAEDGPTVGQDVERTLAAPLRGRKTGGGR